MVKNTEAAVQRRSLEKVFWKYAASLQEKIVKQSNFIEMALRHGYSPVNLLHIFRTSFSKNTSGRLLLKIPVLEEHKAFLRDLFWES